MVYFNSLQLVGFAFLFTSANGFDANASINEIQGFNVRSLEPGQNNGVLVSTLAALLNTALIDYDTRIRPRLNQSQAVVVNVSFIPISVVNLDTTEQKLDVLGFFDIKWTDELIAWTPSDHNGLNVLKLPLTQVWRPRIVVLKSLKSSSHVGNVQHDTVNIVTDDTGSEATVTWVPEDIYSVLCELDVKFYPFDVQNCHLQYYVSDDTFHTVYLNADSIVSLSNYTENAEWELLSIETQTFVEYLTNIVHVSFKLERRAQFTLFTIMIPLLLLSILDVAGFLIPIESGEKISYMVTLFLTFGFFVFILRDGVPHNSLQVSYFLIYLIQLSAISVVSVVYAIAESRVFQTQGDKEFTMFENKVFDMKMWASPLPGKNRTLASTKDSTENKGNRAKTQKVPKPMPPKQNKKKPVKKVPIKWTEFLQKLDLFFASIFAVLVFVFTVFFFATVLNR